MIRKMIFIIPAMLFSSFAIGEEGTLSGLGWTNAATDYVLPFHGVKSSASGPPGDMLHDLWNSERDSQNEKVITDDILKMMSPQIQRIFGARPEGSKELADKVERSVLSDAGGRLH